MLLNDGSNGSSALTLDAGSNPIRGPASDSAWISDAFDVNLDVIATCCSLSYLTPRLLKAILKPSFFSRQCADRASVRVNATYPPVSSLALSLRWAAESAPGMGAYIRLTSSGPSDVINRAQGHELLVRASANAFERRHLGLSSKTMGCAHRRAVSRADASVAT